MDLFMCINGLFIALELKDIGKNPTPLQEYKLNEVKKAKGMAFVVDPESWDEIYEILKEIACSEVELPYTCVEIN